MWGFWGLVFLFQIMRHKSWIDLFVIVAVFSVFLGVLVPFVPGWVIVGLIIGGHIAGVISTLVSEAKGKKKRSANAPVSK